ncbi:hypothetical protein FBR02_16335 [Anaerolineae bacterium CFX9]|nr:hypothetical protein [Anaerolineae bacterium CFX9]
MSEYWRLVPAGRVSIVYEILIEQGPQAGEILRAEEQFSVRPLEIAARPVTNGEFRAFTAAPDGWQDDGWWRYSLDALLQRRSRPKTSATAGDEAPVTQISYWDALACCHWLSAHEEAPFSLPRESELVAAFQSGVEPGPVYEWSRLDRSIPSLSFPLRRGADRMERIGLTTQPDLGFRLARYAPGEIHPFRFQSNPARAAAILDALPRERSFTQRCKLIDELGLLKAAEAVDTLIAILTSPSQDDQAPHGYRPWIIRESAAQALGSIGDARAIPALLQACRHEDLSVSFLAGRSLGRLGRAAYKAACGLLHDPSDKLRRLGANALATIGDAEAIAALEPIAQGDPVESVRRGAQTAIEQLRA